MLSGVSLDGLESNLDFFENIKNFYLKKGIETMSVSRETLKQPKNRTIESIIGSSKLPIQVLLPAI